VICLCTGSHHEGRARSPNLTTFDSSYAFSYYALWSLEKVSYIRYVMLLLSNIYPIIHPIHIPLNSITSVENPVFQLSCFVLPCSISFSLSARDILVLPYQYRYLHQALSYWDFLSSTPKSSGCIFPRMTFHPIT
jgi:hypothetical protein